MVQNENLDYATLGGGCFWCIEAVFSKLRGIHSVLTGYAGGHLTNPTYLDVITGRTGHAEVAQLAYDPSVIGFGEVLDVFFHIHDPTTLNRQGADVGTQYRSIVLYHNQQQLNIAHEVTNEIETSGIWKAPLVTEIAPLIEFYKAEEHHQHYYQKNPNQPYCAFVIEPKLHKISKLFGDKFS